MIERLTCMFYMAVFSSVGGAIFYLFASSLIQTVLGG